MLLSELVIIEIVRAADQNANACIHEKEPPRQFN